VDAPLLLVVVYDENKRGPGSKGDFLGHIGLGCVLENMWLMSEALGIGFHLMTIFGSSAVDKEVRRILKISSPMKIGFACALGYPAEHPAHYARVRRDLDEFVHHNEYGQKDIKLSEHEVLSGKQS
jgi:nitroreductase